jgi:NAD(P)-dependent dehydrogenase (short-subunit alcohol dehydrogenase family)
MRTGLIVGASGGIGAASARCLAASVDRLVLVGRGAAALDRLAAELSTPATCVAVDITVASGRDAILAAVRQDGASLAWTVIASGSPLRGAFGESDKEEVVRTLDVDLVAPILLLRALSDVAWTDRAALVVVGSISASRALPGRAVYGAAKAGLERFCASLAAEWQPRGIRVNVVAPGVVDTPFVGGDRDNLERWSRERIPAARAGRPEEVAEFIRYVVLDAPDFVVGARLVIDGGSESVA